VSRSDTKFTGKMKKEVHSGQFYREVNEILLLKRDNLPCCLNVAFTFTCAGKGVPKGSVVVPGKKLLNDVHRACIAEGWTPPQKPEEFKEWLKKEKWFDIFKKVFHMDVTSLPEENLKSYECLFDCMTDFFVSFHILRPVSTEVDGMVDALFQLHSMLVQNELDPIPFRDLLRRSPAESIVICDCSTYLHYGWCAHSCAYAMDRGIIRGFPKRMDPRSLSSVPLKCGAPKKAKGGKSLEKS
jgi:hypothetical protein